MQSQWKENQKKALRAELYRAGIKLFKKHGFAETTIQDITAEVGVSKGTFFNYFPSKGEILFEYFEKLTLDALEYVEGITTLSAREYATTLMNKLISSAADNSALFCSVCELTRSDKQLLEAEVDLDLRMSNLLVSAIERDQSTGRINKKMDAHVFTTILIDILTSSSHQAAAMNRLGDASAMIGEKYKILFDLAEGVSS